MNDQSLSVRNDIYAASAQMPQYQCHKKVWALQIQGARLDLDQKNWVLSFRDRNTYADITVSAEWFQRHMQPNPQWGGGYYVVYEDGYASFSPQKSFEEGYTRL